MNEADVLIIGAGPSGAVASALLTAAGRSVIVLEKQQFPRFSIGESLLPHCMRFIEMAGMMQPLVDAGYQHKNGAMFVRNGQYSAFDFREKFSPGWGTTYQVVRADFDQLLAREAERLGADVRYRQEILDVELANDRVRLTTEAASDRPRVTARLPRRRGAAAAGRPAAASKPDRDACAGTFPACSSDP